jgi:hypothetical protein
MLLTTDLHLTDSPKDEYRWLVFDEMERQLRERRIEQCYVLGDLTDRRDRHSSALVNRLLDELNRLTEYADVIIIAGNHDAPLNGPPYWRFLSALKGIRYISKPTADGDRLLLPASRDPSADWKGIPFDRYRVVFMHQTVIGATIAKGIYAEGPSFLFPRKLKVYSGDLHIPHRIRNVEYIGAPHHVKYGDDHECRLVILDEDYNVDATVRLQPPSKRIIEVDSVDALREAVARSGDQVRVRVKLDPARLDQWPQDREDIAAWAAQRQVQITSLEGVVQQTSYVRNERRETATDPATVLGLFADAEGLDDALYDAGIALLEEQLAHDTESATS